MPFLNHYIVRSISPANFLLDRAAKDPSLRVVSEALDKTFDLFGEDDGAAAASVARLEAAADVAKRLRAAQTPLKAKIAAARGREGPETLAMASMAKTNLARFLKYKEGKKK